MPRRGPSGTSKPRLRAAPAKSRPRSPSPDRRAPASARKSAVSQLVAQAALDEDGNELRDAGLFPTGELPAHADLELVGRAAELLREARAHGADVPLVACAVAKVRLHFGHQLHLDVVRRSRS